MQKNALLAMAVALTMAICGVVILEGTDAEDIQAEEGMVAYSDTTGQQYPTLADALNATEDGGTVTVLADITGCRTVLIDYDGMKTVDLNNHNITFAQNCCFYMFTGGLTVTGNGTVSETDGLARNGAFVIKLQSGVQPDDDTVHLVIDSGVTAKGYCPVFIDTNDLNAAYGIVIDVHGTLEAMDMIGTTTSGPGIYLNGTNTATDGKTAVINIYDGASISSADALGIYAAGYADWNVYGGTITGSTAMEIRGGSINVYGGKFVATAEEFDATSNGNGSTVVGAALAVSQHTTALPMDVNIYGGEFTGLYALYQTTLETNNEPDKIGMNVQDGKFESTAAGSEHGPVYSEDKTEFIGGGEFSGLNGTEDTKYLATGASVDDQGKVTPAAVSDPVAYVDGRGFDDISDAAGYALAQGKPLEIAKTVTITEDVTIGAVKIVRHDGFTGSMFTVGTAGVTLTIDGATIDGEDRALDQNAYIIKGTDGSIVLNGVTVENGEETTVFADGAELTVRDSVFRNNHSTFGTIYVGDSNVTIVGSEFTGNSTLDHGAAVRIQNTNSDISVTITDSVITGNNTPGNGAVYALAHNHSITLTLDGVTIKDNTQDDDTGEDVFTDFRDDTKNSPTIVLKGICDIGKIGIATSSSSTHPLISEAIHVEEGFGLKDPETPISLVYEYDDGKDLIVGTAAEPEFFDLGDSSLTLVKTDTGLKVAKLYNVNFKLYTGTVTVKVISGEAIDPASIPESDRAGFSVHHWFGSDSNTWDTTTPVTASKTLWPYWQIEDGTVTIGSDSTGSTYELKATVSDYDGAKLEYSWSTGSTAANAVATADGVYSVTVTVSDPDRSYVTPKTLTAQITVDGHSVAFYDGDELVKAFYVRDGASIAESEYPTVGDKVGYDFSMWAGPTGQAPILTAINSDVLVNAKWMLETPGIDVSFSGSLNDGGILATITATHVLDGLTYTYIFGDIESDAPMQVGEDNTYLITAPGNYGFAVYATDADGVESDMAAFTQVIEVESEPSFPTPPIIDDDDYVPLPPQIVYEEEPEDNTVEIVACAAAAVVAALMAAFLIIERRKS